MEHVKIGVFGGSGFYQIGENVEEVQIDTPFGSPSSSIFIATIEGKRVAFLPRHGVNHSYPPHKINYRANLWAMKELGVKFLLGPCASGSLQLTVKPGDIVFCDQFVNQAYNRVDTFYDEPPVTHISCAEPYCETLRKLAIEVSENLGLSYHKTGTVVIIDGPRFASRAESQDFTARGWHVINMTQYPEMVLARELEMCYLNISLITDYDSGLQQEIAKTNASDIVAVFKKNLENLKLLLAGIVKVLPENASCACHKSLENARF